MEIGEYWSATSDELFGYDDAEWLFLIVAKATHNRKKCVLAVKCNWESRKPVIGENSNASWFYETGDGIGVFDLVCKERGSGRKYLTPNTL